MLERLTDRFPALKMAYRNLSRTKVRSTLAALGIIIGVVAIASLGVFGVTLQASVSGNLGDIGNQLIVTPSNEDGVTELTNRDVDQIRLTSSTATVTPIQQDVETVDFGGEEPPPQQVILSVQQPSRVYEATDGRIPVPLRSGVLVGESLAESQDLGPGSTITINGSSERVRAVITSPGNSRFLDPADKIIVPGGRSTGGYDRVVVTESSGEAANATAMEIRESLNDRQQRVSIQDLSSVVDEIKSVFQTLNIFLLGVGAISLLVASISILNVMLMSTVERREEIGVLRAVGFKKRDVVKMMLAEASLLGLFGGLVGVVFSLGTGLLINHLILDDALAVFNLASIGDILMAFLFGLIASVISGLYPAWKAANEEPVDALRG